MLEFFQVAIFYDQASSESEAALEIAMNLDTVSLWQVMSCQSLFSVWYSTKILVSSLWSVI